MMAEKERTILGAKLGSNSVVRDHTGLAFRFHEQPRATHGITRTHGCALWRTWQRDATATSGRCFVHGNLHQTLYLKLPLI